MAPSTLCPTPYGVFGGVTNENVIPSSSPSTMRVDGSTILVERSTLRAESTESCVERSTRILVSAKSLVEGFRRVRLERCEFARAQRSCPPASV